jgi:Tol biopolymer transport system component
VTQDTALATFSIHCNAPELGADTTASIVFERGGYVMLVRESGGSPVALTEGTSPAWSPDGELIAFQKSNCYVGQGCERDVWLTTPGGTSQWPVTLDPNFDDYDAAFSPNANRIAFIRFWLGPDQSYLVTSDLQGGSLKILSIWNPVYTPSWSPDGAQVAFVCEGVVWSGSLDICLAHTDKGCDSYFPSRCDLPLTALTTRFGDELDPAWSPDGRRIAFTLACGFQSVCQDSVTSAEPYVAVIDVATREVTRLVAGHDPAWSPDGLHLVFVGNASSPGLRVYNFVDGSARQLTNDPVDKSPSWRE